MMTMNQYFYHIIVPNNNTVRVRKLTPQLAEDKVTGKLDFSQIKNKITKIIKAPDNLDDYWESEQITNLVIAQINDKIREIIEASDNLESQQITKVGEALFETLFDSQLREDFLAYYQEIVKQKQQNLAVILEAIPELAAYPWELMCLPEQYNQGEIYFATDRKLSFYRCRYQSQEIDKLSIQINKNEQLKIALVVSIPTADPQLSDDVEYQEVKQYLKQVDSEKEQVKFLPVMDSLDFYEIVERLETDKPDIFHFIGHGQLIEKDGEEVGQIAFVGEFGKADWKDAKTFVRLFNSHKPKIVILQACETGKQSQTNAFSSVASRLILQRIPVVIAMQYKVSNLTAVSFVKEFYSRIVKGDSVEMAVQKARFKLSIENGYDKRYFATPVIFMAVQDGHLFESATSANEETKDLNLSNSESEKTKGLSVFDIDTLVDILIRSGRVNTLSSRRSLCISIQVNPSDIGFIENVASRDFAEQLIYFLDQNKKFSELFKLCEKIANNASGFRAELNSIQNKLNCN
ncbi:MAG: CHAT domain-containing protein [Okeania sp. SIO3B5]|uniref:CHAT domain-containing protein n=1 Tax=Okeania sp. SIO3B5 TaxID=2607811 RepID=UPI0013FEF81E|nr:CHAT domain-containing protein [Okeania sp. SIO3B5]NEO53321.1 CHAT domain-containing protein [Okeania sp. SIO3B5]